MLTHTQNNLSWVTFRLPHLKNICSLSSACACPPEALTSTESKDSIFSTGFAEAMLLIANFVSLVLLYSDTQRQMLGSCSGSQGDQISKLSPTLSQVNGLVNHSLSLQVHHIYEFWVCGPISKTFRIVKANKIAFSLSHLSLRQKGRNCLIS